MDNATLRARIEARVTVTADGCWEWQGARLPKGYGRIGIDGSVQLVHRVMYTLDQGQIPEGLHVLHSCDNPPCCNPGHLRAGTPSDNMLDAVERGRHYEASRTHCDNGHAFDAANTRIGKRGARECRSCARRHHDCTICGARIAAPHAKHCEGCRETWAERKRAKVRNAYRRSAGIRIDAPVRRRG